MPDDTTNPNPQPAPPSNQVVAWYRSQNPTDSSSDDDITLKAAAQYPDTFQTYPDAVSDYQRIIKQLQVQSLTPLDYATQPLKAAAAGAIKGFADIPEAIGTAAVSLSKSTGFKGGEPDTPEETASYQFGKYLESLAPEPNEALSDSFALSKLPGAIGSFAPYLAGAGGGKILVKGGLEALTKTAGEDALKEATDKGLSSAEAKAAQQAAMKKVSSSYVAHLAENVPVALTGAAQAGVSGYNEAIAKGADEATALGPVFWYNAAGGSAAFALPVSNWLDRMNKASDGILGKSIIDTGLNATKSAGLGAAYGAATQFADNYIAQKYYDKDRSLLKDMAESAGTNAAAAGLFDVVISGISKALFRSKEQVKQQAQAPKVSEPIKNTQAYELPDDQKQNIESVVAREMSGEQTPDIVASINKIITDPNKNVMAFYLLRRNQIAQGIEPKETELDYGAGGEMIDQKALGHVEEQVNQAKEVFQKSAKENGNDYVIAGHNVVGSQIKNMPDWVREEMVSRGLDPNRPLNDIDVQNPSMIEAINSDPTLTEEQKTAVLTTGSPKLAEARATAASPKVETTKTLAPVIPKGMQLVKVQMPDGSVAPGGFNGYHDFSDVGLGVRPAVSVLNADGQWTGMPKEAKVLSKIPSLEEWKAKTSATKDLITQSPDFNIQSYETTPESLIKLVGVGSGEQQVVAGKVVDEGIGQKTEPAYRDTNNWEVAAKDSRADKDRTESRKMVVLASPDDSHVLIATIRPSTSRGKTNMILAGKNPKTGESKTIRVENVEKTGYKLIGSIKSQTPTRDFIAGYSMKDWQGIREELMREQEAGKNTAAAMERQLSGVTMPIYPGEHSEREAPIQNALSTPQEEPEGGGAMSNDQAEKEAAFREEGEERADVLEPGQFGGSEDAIQMKGKTSSTAKSIVPTDTEIKELSKSVELKPFDKDHAQTIIDEYGGGPLTPEDAMTVLEDLAGAEFGSKAYVALHSLVDTIRSGNIKADDETLLAHAANALARASNEEAGKSDPAENIVQQSKAEALTIKSAAGKPAEVEQNPSVVARNRGSTLTNPDAALSGRASDGYIARAYKSATDALRNNGVDTRLITQKVGELVKEFGRYDEWKGQNGEVLRSVTLSAADHQHPSLDNLIAGIHEIGHVVLSDERPETQVLMHKAVEGLRVDNFIPKIEALERGVPITPERHSVIENEERMVESMARNLVKEGFDPVASKGIAQTILRMLKQLYLRVAMKLSEAFGFPPSEQRAMDYFQSRVESFLAGDSKAFSFLTSMGGPRYTEIRRDYEQAEDAVRLIRNTDSADHPLIQKLKSEAIRDLGQFDYLDGRDKSLINSLPAVDVMDWIRSRGYNPDKLLDFMSENWPIVGENSPGRDWMNPREGESVGEFLMRLHIRDLHGGIDAFNQSPSKMDESTGLFIREMKDPMREMIRAAGVKYKDDAPIFSDSRYTRWRDSMHSMNDPRAEISSDLDATEVTKVKVALQNKVHDFLSGLYREFNQKGYNTSNLSFADFVNSNNFVRLPKQIDGIRWYDTGQLPKDLIDGFNHQLISKGKPIVPDDFSIKNIENPQWRERVQASAHRILSHLIDDMAQHRMEADEHLDQMEPKSLFNKFKQDNENLSQLVKFYQNLNLITNNVVTRLRDSFTEAKADLKKIGLAGRKQGMLEQVINGIEGRQDDQITKDYAGIIDHLFDRLTKDDGYADKFTDTLQRMAQMEIDWKNTPVADIRRRLVEEYQTSEDFNLKPVVGADRESRALLSMAITFAKQNDHVMQLLELRKSNALEELPVVQKALQTAMGDHKDAINEAQMLAAKLPKLKVAAVRLIQGIAELKKSNYDKWAQIQRDLAFTKVHEDTRRSVQVAMAGLEKAAKIQFKDWQPVEGANIPVWDKGATLDSVYEREGKPLTLRSNGMVSEDVRSMIKNLRAGLDSVPEELRGARYNEMEDVYRKLSAMDMDWAQKEIKSSLLNRIIAPLPEKIRFAGTPGARLAASMIHSKDSWEHARTHSSTSIGRKWEGYVSNLMRATGLRNFKMVEDVFYQPALGWLEKRPDLTVSTKSDAEAQEVATKAVVEHFMRDPNTAELLGRKGALPAFIGMMRQSFSNARWQEQEGAKDHRKVLDQSTNYSVLRKALGSTPNTMPRKLSAAGELAFKAARDRWSGDGETKAKVSQDYAQDRNALDQRLQAKMSPEVIDQFIRPWINRDGRSAFYSPDKPDGLHDFASRDNVIKAFESSNGNLVQFAENLYHLEGGTTPIEDFVGETVSSVQAFYDLMHNMFMDSEMGIENGKPTPGRVISDARVSEELPKEFYKYLTMDRHTMHRMVQMQAYEISMGRNIQAFKDVMDSSIREQHDLMIRYNQIVDGLAAQGLRGRKLKVEAYRIAKEKYPNLSPLMMEQARKSYISLRQSMDQMEGVLTLNRDRSPELRPWLNLVRSMVGATVSGPGTFLTVLEHTIEQPFRIFGFGGGIKYLTGETKDMAGVMMNSLLQTVGLQTSQDAFWSKKQTDLGMFDDDATATMIEKINTAFTHQYEADNQAARIAQGASNVIKLALSTGVGRAIPGKAIYPTLKPGGFFQTGAAMIHMSNTTRFWKTYSSMVAGAVEHFNLHPEDYHDENFKFTPAQLKKEIGWYSNDRAWNFLHTKLAEYGVGNLEQVAREAIDRRKSDGSAPMLTDDQFVKLAHLVQNEITMESNVGSRAPWFVSDPIGSLCNPLVGWAVEKTYAAGPKAVRQPSGEGGIGAAAALAWRGDYGRSLEAIKGFRSGLMAFAAILPAAMAYAVMRDKYDEYIAGRKQNVLDLTTVHDPGSAVEATLDNVSRLGTLGLFGEAVDQAMVGAGQAQRPISLDSRIFFANAIGNIGSAFSNWAHQGYFDYQSVGRPLLQSLGGNGYLQYAAVINNLMGLDNTESRVSNRISVNNYLRVAGKVNGFDVNKGSYSSFNGATPNPVKPQVGRMILAAYANDASEFADARRQALRILTKEGKEDPARALAQAYEAYSPLRLVFRTEPDEQDYQKLLRSMDDNGRQSTQEAMNLFQHYGTQIGAKIDFGKPPKQDRTSPYSFHMPSLNAPSLNDLRRMAAF